jgi:D-alanine-D-alanine ligase-like ATP-grasp enzyme
MKSLDLNSGSFDIIFTKQNKFVLLEVNPIGQFHWLSKNCNYKIEKIIANYLI